jgi:UDP-glucose 4-epimerase
MKVLVTGAAGRIGSHTCRHLHAAGFEVRAADIMPRQDLPVRLEVVNLLERESCYRVMEGMEAVVHLANHPTFQRGGVPQALFNENVTMNMNVFQAACDLGVPRLVFSSSVQTISTAHRMPQQKPHQGPLFPQLPLDGHIPARPQNPYALSKAVSEEMLRYFASVYGMTTVAIRFPYVVDDERVSHFREHKVSRVTSQEEAFTYLHVNDAVRLIEMSLKAELTGYHQYFPAAQDAQIAADLPALMARHFSGIAWRDGAAPLVLVDISEITRETGWTPLFNSLLTVSPP